MPTTPATYNYYPSLSDLMKPQDLPDFLSFIKDGLQAVFDKMYYKDYQTSRSISGSSAFYSLDIVSRKKLQLELPGTGVFFVLNPDYNDSTISSFPVTVFWEWEIMRYIRYFNLNGFSFSPEDFYNLALQILNISEEQVIQLAINTFVVQSNPAISKFSQLVQDINALYSANIAIDESAPNSIQELIIQVNVLNKKIAPAVFSLYLLQTDLNETKEKIKTFFSSFIPNDFEAYIKKIITPKARVTLELTAAVEFPRKMLKPVNDDGTDFTHPDPDFKTQFRFAKALLYADTQAGIGYNLELAGTLFPKFSSIGNTGILIQIESLKLDLSKTSNIAEADADGRPNDFTGVYARAISVTLPARWFQDEALQGTPATTLRIGGYDLLIGTGGVSGTFALEAVASVITGGTTYYFEDKFTLQFPVTLLQKNPTTSIIEETIVADIATLKNKLFPVGSTTAAPCAFKFPLTLTEVAGGTQKTFKSAIEYQAYTSSFATLVTTDTVPTLWKKLGGENGFRIGFNKFDITFKQNKVISSNIRAALEIKKFVYPASHPTKAGQTVHIDIEGHLHDNGDFNLTASANPPYPIVLKDVFTYNLKSVELGKINGENGQKDLFYIGTAGTIQFEGFLKDTMGLGPIEIERLRIYSDGSIELKGGSVNLIKPIVLKLGPVEITVSAIHYGSHQKEVNGIMRKFNYFGFDGGISVDPLGIEIRGDGVKFYYCSDDIDTPQNPKPKPYLHIKTIYLDLTLPAKSPVAIVKGWLTIPEPGVSKEYAGGLKLDLPKLKITGSVDMKLMPKYPAFIIDASLDFPAPIPLGPIGIYGFRGLFGYRYVAEKSAVAGAETWYDYYKAPQRGINIRKFNNPEQTKLSGTPISIGAGASLGTSADNGTVLNIKAMVLLSIPALFMIDGRATVLSARLGLEDSGEPPFFAFIAVGDDSLELGFGADFKMPTSSGSMLSLYADIQAGFFFKNQKPWYVNIGTKTNPVTSRILSLITLKSYVMLSARGIEAGSRGEFDFRRQYGIIRVHAWAYVEVGGKISFERPQFGAYLKAGVGADIDIKFLSFYLAVDIMFGVEASKPFKIFGSFYYRVRIRILWVFKFSFSGQLSVVWEFNNQIDTTPINPMIGNATSPAGQNALQDLVRGVNMLSNEPFDLAYLGGVIPSGLNSEILNNIIPIDTYIDIKTEKGLLPGGITALIGGYTNPAESYTDLVPPDANVQGKALRQVTHQYSIQKLEVRFWNGVSWQTYHPYEAIYPNDSAVSGLKIGQFQKTDGMYNKVRLLATTPFSYTEQGQPGWFVPEQNGITAASLFCEGRKIDSKCANFELKPLNYKYYCSNENHQLFSNDAAFRLLDVFQTSYAEISNETYFTPITKSLKFDNFNQMQILLPKASVQVGLKVSNFTKGVRVKYYSRYFDPNDLSGTAPLQYCNPETGVINQPHEIIKTASELSVKIEYNHGSWRPVTRIVIEPLYDPATALQIALLTEQIAIITENNNLISLGEIEGEIQDTTQLENELHLLACGAGEASTDSSFINRYKKVDSLNYSYSKEFIEYGSSFIYAIGKTDNGGLISKIKPTGDIVWERSYKINTEEQPLTFKRIIQLQNTNAAIEAEYYFQYVVYATTGKNQYLLSINFETGEVIWSKKIYWQDEDIILRIEASKTEFSFYITISDRNQIDTNNNPFIGKIDGYGNFKNGNLLILPKQEFIINAIDTNEDYIVVAGRYIEEDSRSTIIRLNHELKILDALHITQPYTTIHDIKIVNGKQYLISGYNNKMDGLFVMLIKDFGSNLIYNFPKTKNHSSVLELSNEGFYLLQTTENNGVLLKLNWEMKLEWTKEIKIKDNNGVRNFTFNSLTKKISLNAYNQSTDSLVVYTNKDLQSCMTNTLQNQELLISKCKIERLEVTQEKYGIDIKDFNVKIKVLKSDKKELCPSNSGCGEENVELCTLYNNILSIFNDCFDDPKDVNNQNIIVAPKVICARSILSLVTNFDISYNLTTIFVNEIALINSFIIKMRGQSLTTHNIRECICYENAYIGVQQILNYLNENGNCNCHCDAKNYTLLHEVCWMSIEDYQYNLAIPDQAAIEADTQATILGLNTYIQPVWRPDTSYYVHFVLRDLVNYVSPKDYLFTYGFTTGGPVGYFHKHPKSTYGDMLLKIGQFLDTDKGSIPVTADLNGKILQDTKGTIKNPDGSPYTTPLLGGGKIAAHPDKYALTSLSQYIDYERSYPNANGNLLGAKPLFYNDDSTQIYLFFNKAYVTNFFRDWPLYKGKNPQKGMLKIVIKDPVENISIDNPPALDYIPSITTIPQSEQEWNSDLNPQVPFVLSQYSAMLNSGNNCILKAKVIKPKSKFVTITPKHLKPNKLYTAIVNNMYDVDFNNAFGVTTAERLKETQEVHSFVFKTSRYANFKEQIESFLIKQTIDGVAVQKEAIFKIERAFTQDQVNGVYNTIIGQPVTGFNATILKNLEANYQHPFDRMLEGILGLKPLDEAISTEVNVVRNLNDNKIIAVIVRNPEPFNNPKMPLIDVQDTLQVLSGTSVNIDYKVLFSKDYSQAIIMPSNKEITTNLTLQFKYKLWDGFKYVVQNIDPLTNLVINPAKPVGIITINAVII